MSFNLKKRALSSSLLTFTSLALSAIIILSPASTIMETSPSSLLHSASGQIATTAIRNLNIYSFYPFGVAVDSKTQNVIVADSGNSRIQMFSNSGYLILQWGTKGTGNGQFDGPRDVAIDSDRRTVFVSDSGNHRIQQFILAVNCPRLTTQVVPGVCFVAKWDTPEPFGIGVDPKNGIVYLADRGHDLIQRFKYIGGNIQNIGSFGGHGTGPGQLNDPLDVAVEPNGIVLVTDKGDWNGISGAGRIQRFDLEGLYDGTFASPNNYPVFIDVDLSNGDVFVTMLGSHIERYSSNGGAPIKLWNVAGDVPFEYPVGVAIDSKTHNVFVVDYDAARIQKFTNNGGYLSQWKHGINTVLPGKIAVDPSSGDVYVADTKKDRILKFQFNNSCPRPVVPGVCLRTWGSYGTGDGQFIDPIDVGVHPLAGGYVAVSDSGHGMQVFSTDGEFLWDAKIIYDDFAIDPNPSTPIANRHLHSWRPVYGIEVHAINGDLISNKETSGYMMEEMALTSPIGNAEVNIFTLNRQENKVHKVNLEGDLIKSWGSSGTSHGKFDFPMDIAVHPSTGHVFVVDMLNHRIQKFANNGAIIDSWGSRGLAQGQFNYPTAIAVDPKYGVFVLDSGNNRVQRFDTYGRNMQQWPIVGLT